MSKIMSILEKYNLVEKGIIEKPQNTDSNWENNIQLSEVLNNENNILEIEAIDLKEEFKLLEPVIKEKSKVETNTAYEKKMMINEIYSLYELENSDINTVFMLQNFINALPQNLPKDVIKESVINIINASKVDLNHLLSDGEQRLEVLGKVMDGYYNQTNKRISEYKEEIAKLLSLINDSQEQIKIKESVLEEQIYLIKSESLKIDGIINFFAK
ncbi:hypothetical protein G9F72_002825 [Clostridium estertheticum]|uniref:hypothetical protein n=1 Tax=Clostridium estertheticum TaxID=238834 RepID=UPI0013E936CE|nr:hypothetical protein [Clostridium estertheticum]MBZ9685283.1 hypothetical protein [Clostridium estertheticum]